ncbi:MAG TPA: LuxR C-terminal-related transcriptional regulator [Ktedonobacteraceae bacterium]
MSIVVGSEQWFAWLDKETSTTFSFSTRDGSYTARRERVGNRRGGWYWKAYRRHQGTLYHAYLGKTEQLTLARLSEIALTLSARMHEQTKRTQNTPKEEYPSDYQKHIIPVIPLLETKLHPPQLPALLVDRTHLLTRLNAIFAHKLTLLLAPAGSGKTTLVNQWLTAYSVPPTFASLAWVSLDTGDNDPLRFWRYVITACQTLLGQEQKVVGQDALALLATAIHPPFEQIPIDIVLTHLLNDLARSSTGGLLILDDYHVITEPHISEALAFFIDHLPKTVHVLLLSRVEPSLPLLRWRARGELYELHTADLRFSSEETATFLRQTLPIPLSEVAFTRLDTSLEGWVAGLRLLSLTLSGWRTSQAVELALLSLDKRGGFSTPYRSLFDYFVTEILETQPEPLQRFLLQTSVLSRLCGPLCDAVTKSENSAIQLEAIARAGLFLEVLEGPGGWYRYHALFAEAMHREASRRLGEEALQALSLQASVWYAQEALLTEAIEAARLSQNMERMARLIEQIDILTFHETQTMQRWLELLPETILRTHPMLCHLFAVELRFPAELRFTQATPPLPRIIPLSDAKRSRIEMLLQMAEEGWQKQGMTPWIGTNWAFRVLSGLLDLEPFPSLVYYAQQALSFLPWEETQNRYLRMYRSSCLLFVGIEKLRLGQIGEAQRLLLQAQEDNIDGNRYLNTDIALILGKIYLIQGELQQARRYYGQVLSDAKKLGDEEMEADSLLELAWLAFEWDNFTDAEQQAHEALEVAHRIHPPMQELSDRATLQFVLLQQAQGETMAALEQLTALLSTPQRVWTPGSLWLLARLRDWQARLRIATGDVQAVQDSLSTQSQHGEISITEHLREQILWGRLWLAQGKIEDALEQFARLLPMAQEHLHQYMALEIQLLLALSHAARKQEQQAYYWLRQTLLQTVQEGYIRLFLNEGKPMLLLLRSLLPTIQHDTTLRSYIQTILRAATPQKTISVSPSDSLLLEPLSTQEQRVLQLLAAGWSNQDIAHELIVSVNTVKYHIKHLYQKLGVSNRLQASTVARRLGDHRQP